MLVFTRLLSRRVRVKKLLRLLKWVRVSNMALVVWAGQFLVPRMW